MDRVPVLLHADDPVFVASSRGEATRTLQVIASWALDVRVELHLESSKTVVQIFHPPAVPCCCEAFVVSQTTSLIPHCSRRS